MKRLFTLLGAVAVVASVLAVGPAGGSTEAIAVADTDPEYIACGRVFPDPHAYWPSPTQVPNQSPWAKGNFSCKSTDFLPYAGNPQGDMVSGMTYLETLFPQFVQFHKLERDFGTNINCATTVDPEALCSAGLPKAGTPITERLKSDLYMVRITDENVPNTNKKYFVFPLSIHGIERAGAEAGVRAAEDLATWGWCEARMNNEVPPHPNALVNPMICPKEGAIPHPLLEAQPGDSLMTGPVLKQSVIYFIFPNPDGWRRGDPDNIVRSFQRYNGNGVDLNRDWPTVGYTHRPYTPWSEPETRGFGKVLKGVKDQWTGGIDLHGQLVDRAFSFTLMGASERDYGKDQRILQTVKGAWEDAEARLDWSPSIIPNNEPQPPCQPSPVGGSICPQMYGVQWGTVWDTINYTVTGSLGDWIDSPNVPGVETSGLGADGIDNEMSFSHLINCGTGTCYQPEWEQLHVDGNKSLVYSMVNFSLLPEDQVFEAPGRVGYLLNPVPVSDPGSTTPQPPPGLPTQAPILNVVLSPLNNYTHQFTIRGPNDTPPVYNGGVEGTLDATNVQGLSAGSVTSLVLEFFGGEGTPQATACGSAGDGWNEVNRYFNQASTYVQAGQAVHADSPEPGEWRICLTPTPQAVGVADLDIAFTSEKVWPNPGQLPYSVTNMNFFTELAQYMLPGQMASVSVASVLAGSLVPASYRSFVVTDEALSAVPAGQEAAFGQRLRDYVQARGNLVLTDSGLEALGPAFMNVVPAGQVGRTYFYAGYIAFTSNGGANETYSDPLAVDIDQPGAAEGAGHRHQTYEPVPLGMDIGSRQSCSGSQCTAPIWTVNQSSWLAAGGRVVGQSVANRVAFGEAPLGLGKIRIVGALLPMPTEQYYHPYGLANYAVTYSGYQVFQNTLRVNVPTSVKVTSFAARRTGRTGVTVTWRATSDFGALGYNVWRFVEGKGVKVNRARIAAKPGERARGATYRLLDRTAKRGITYTYRLQVVRANGTRAWAGTAVRVR